MQIAKVNAEEEPGLKMRYRVHDYPELHLFLITCARREGDGALKRRHLPARVGELDGAGAARRAHVEHAAADGARVHVLRVEAVALVHRGPEVEAARVEGLLVLATARTRWGVSFW